MKRSIEPKLLDWKNSKGRKPLLLVGARQVGKSHSVIEFGRANYANIVVFNFEGNETLRKIFDMDLDPERIVTELEGFSSQTIVPQETLVFFDEIQACGRAMTSLKYFYEQCPDYHIIAAGSLLGSYLVREPTSFPVGKVNILTMYPVTFLEFLTEMNPAAIPLIKEAFEKNVQLTLHDKMLELYRMYLFTGGMPEAVAIWKDRRDPVFVSMVHQDILTMYIGDMGKYSSPADQVKTRAVYNSLPAQLAKENKKFQYSVIGSRARAADYEAGVDWLESAGIALRCRKTGAGEIPLASNVDLTSYKIYMNDVGLLNAKSSVPPITILSERSNISGGAKGAMAENYVMQELTANGLEPYYWESNGKAEIDFVVQMNDKVIPIEVKAADNVKAKSLQEFVKKYSPEYSIRASAKNFGFDNGIKSVPFYALWCIQPT
ncbi:MAG: DUF4143 domain-containing protein [Methanomassiliicoccaceae archaeon]|nr:DUF4143 domain-containing protein [Methanomassiliicoccaceae archaeon]MCL2145722.1 DUF4143 domain-containing protein [Methanomassiliicoccaceae archaeon]